MQKLDEIQKRLLSEVADLHKVPEEHIISAQTVNQREEPPQRI